MIHVDRPEGPAVLTDPKGEGAKETQEAIDELRAHIEKHPDGAADWKFPFKAYKHGDVKAALEKIFHGKCAYCESYYRGTQPVDVEHWRPKGRTVPAEGEKAQKPAYYWLAATWENLLPSCIDCNRKRKQHDVVEDRIVSVGKMDEFPLRDPARRATAPPEVGDLPAERPLLLDPCADDPAEFLEFDPDWRCVLRPRQSSELAREMASQSIRVYGLNRVGLVMNRQELCRLLELRIATVKALTRVLIEEAPEPKREARDGDRDSGEGGAENRQRPLGEHIRQIIEERLMAELKELARARRREQPFALLARQLIDSHMAEFEVPDLGDDHLASPAEG